MEIKEVKLSDLKPYKENAKKHPKKQIDLLKQNIERFGFTTPVLIDSAQNIIAGHGRLLAMKELGREAVPCVVMGTLTEEEIKALRLADNRIAEMGEWDMDLVIAELKDISTPLLDLTGFSKDLIIEPEERDDVVPAVPDEPQSKLGDLYELGNHRILCGDSTKLEDVERLMDGKKADLVVTDPPYNTGMKEKKGDEKDRLSHMFNDSIEDWPKFLNDIFTNYFTNTKGQCAFYVFIDWRKVQDIKQEMEKIMDVRNVIVWDKGVHGLGSDYKFTYELCVVGKKGKPEINNRYGLDYQDIWRVQRIIGRNKDHATAKPIDLLEKPIIHASKEDDIVLDLFLGSGSTLIAAQKTNRVCYGVELEPKYVDVIVSRYCKYMGINKIKKNGEEIEWVTQ